MNFREATDAILSPRSIGTVARALGVSEASVKAARLPEDARGYRKPPTGWERHLAAFADGEQEQMRLLARYLRRAEEQYHGEKSSVDKVANQRGILGRGGVGGESVSDGGGGTDPSGEVRHRAHSHNRDKESPACGSGAAHSGAGLASGGGVKREARAPSTGESDHASDTPSASDEVLMPGEPVEAACIIERSDSGTVTWVTGVDPILGIRPARVPFTKERQTGKKNK